MGKGSEGVRVGEGSVELRRDPSDRYAAGRLSC